MGATQAFPGRILTPAAQSRHKQDGATAAWQNQNTGVPHPRMPSASYPASQQAHGMRATVLRRGNCIYAGSAYAPPVSSTPGLDASYAIKGARSAAARAHAARASSSNSSASFFITVPPSSSASTIVTARR